VNVHLALSITRVTQRSLLAVSTKINANPITVVVMPWSDVLILVMVVSVLNAPRVTKVRDTNTVRISMSAKQTMVDVIPTLSALTFQAPMTAVHAQTVCLAIVWSVVPVP